MSGSNSGGLGVDLDGMSVEELTAHMWAIKTKLKEAKRPRARRQIGAREPEWIVPVSEIVGLGFIEIGEWKLVDGQDVLDCEAQGSGANSEPATYVIASVRPDSTAVVLYVGMGSDGWELRRENHVRHSDRFFHEIIKRELKGETRRVLVFERISSVEEHFGHFASTAGVEEAALMARFRPTINRPSDVTRALAFHQRQVAKGEQKRKTDAE